MEPFCRDSQIARGSTIKAAQRGILQLVCAIRMPAIISPTATSAVSRCHGRAISPSSKPIATDAKLDATILARPILDSGHARI